jgi:hypothetical protein
MCKAYYRKLNKYKYQLVKPYNQVTGITGYTIDTTYVRLTVDGRLEISNGYAWDGPSGPTFDTVDFLRGSLVHDALYQLIRLEQIPFHYKNYADLLLKKICLEDGMSGFMASCVYQSVKYFGGASARPGSEKPDRIYRVPCKSPCY